MSKQSNAEAEAKELILSFCTCPPAFNNARHTCSRAVGALVIAHGLTFAYGKPWFARTKSLGCGVYHIFFEEAP